MVAARALVMRAILFNVVLLSMLISCSIVLWKINYSLSLLWSLSNLFMLYYYLRKHLCTNCPFYGKPCFSGWGLLAAKMFPKGSGNWERGRSLAPLTWPWFLVTPPLVTSLYSFSSLFLMMWSFASLYLLLEFHSFHSKCPLKEKCSGFTKAR